MRDALAEHGVQVVALSKNTVAEAATQKARDGLGFTLLADPELAVIRQYGVEHHKSLGYETTRFSLGGLPLGFRPRITAMAIPTSLLVDEAGVVRWVDQADDYRLRSDDDRVLSAAREAFS